MVQVDLAIELLEDLVGTIQVRISYKFLDKGIIIVEVSHSAKCQPQGCVFDSAFFEKKIFLYNSECQRKFKFSFLMGQIRIIWGIFGFWGL